MLLSLTLRSPTTLESTRGRVNDKNSDVSLGSTSNHVLDEISVSRCVNDSKSVLGGLEFPQGNINCNTWGLNAKWCKVIESIIAQFLGKRNKFLAIMIEMCMENVYVIHLNKNTRQWNILPLSRSAFKLSRTQAYLKEDLPNSAASFSYFSMVRLSIPPH